MKTSGRPSAQKKDRSLRQNDGERFDGAGWRASNQPRQKKEGEKNRPEGRPLQRVIASPACGGPGMAYRRFVDGGEITLEI